MDLMPGYLSRMICHFFDLPLPVFRGSKVSIRKKLSLQQLRRPYRIQRLYVWEARLSSLSVFSVPVSLWNPLDGCAAVGLAAGQGGSV